MNGLPVWKLALLMMLPAALAYVLRGAAVRRFVLARPLIAQAGRQFRVDFLLLSLAGMVSGVGGHFLFGFTWSQSGSKVLLGALAFGIFAGVDLALERERLVIRKAMDDPRAYQRPVSKLSPLTRKFFFITMVVMVLATVIMSLVLVNDINWLAGQDHDGDIAGMLVRSVITDTLVVALVLFGHIVNLVYSYSLNLRLLFGNQTGALEHVTRGDLDAMVPAVTQDEFGLIAGHTNAMIEGLRDRERMKEGLRVAQGVQQRLLPRQAPFFPGLDIAGRTSYSDETGGDYFDFIDSCGEGRVGIAVGDVTGHGVGAAMLMTTARGLLRLRMELAGDLARSMDDVNRLLCRDTYGTGRFMTLFYLVIDSRDRSLVWSCAGHDPALLYSPGRDEFIELECGDMPLGVADDVGYREFSREPLERGEALIIGTDGIWEARNRSGEMFGKKRYREAVAAAAAGSAEEMVNAVLGAVETFRDGAQQSDDLTLVVVKARS